MTKVCVLDSIKLDYCWICSNQSSLEEHHIIPSAYGGRNGPLVTLCAICHSAVHAVSHKNIDTTRSDDLCVFCDRWCATNAPKVMYLVNLIRKARYLTKNDANKTVKVSYTLDAQIARKLKYTAQQLGISQEVAIGVAIQDFHDRLFGRSS